MINIESVKLEIIKRLEPLNLDKVILFGSYAYGTPNIDSDIDLYVVTNDEYTPQSWKEKSELTRKVSRNLRDLRSKFAIDLIVHTKEMNRKFIELNSSFSREILSKGSLIL
ncbi:MAG: DNA polymerase subunit beta [uncultured Sulfurovum sp.]|uniref:DNA polymerase subunit beta n=1 Tax=uncultured Sulfurovum sp. TaxID=269237 RepID=A0A6S6S4X3_9BACT|nr:MAG: DNA polymerase subunit beta [uncultured Sulfurovum sp.]